MIRVFYFLFLSFGARKTPTQSLLDYKVFARTSVLVTWEDAVLSGFSHSLVSFKPKILIVRCLGIHLSADVWLPQLLDI